MSRSTIDIVTAIGDGEAVSPDEASLAATVMSHQLYQAEKDLRDLLEVVAQGNQRHIELKASFLRQSAERRFAGRKLPPADYLGPTYTPGSPEHARFRETCKRIFKNATGQDL